jgi:transposase InsO family protein
MRQEGLSAKIPKRFVHTTQADERLPVAENVLDRQFETPDPNTRWSGDITYVWTQEGWLYLAVLLDLFSRRVIGWSMGTTLERSLVLSALEMALSSRQPSAGLVCHSDRGSQYASAAYQGRLSEVGIVCSMSRKGNCWDNAPVESFFASLKRELVHRTSFPT